jgi:hypothetical protein
MVVSPHRHVHTRTRCLNLPDLPGTLRSTITDMDAAGTARVVNVSPFCVNKKAAGAAAWAGTGTGSVRPSASMAGQGVHQHIPGMNMPGMNMPGMNMPGMNMPGMNMPGMNMPGMQPGMNIPGMNMPGMQPGMMGMHPHAVGNNPNAANMGQGVVGVGVPGNMGYMPISAGNMQFANNAAAMQYMAQAMGMGYMAGLPANTGGFTAGTANAPDGNTAAEVQGGLSLVGSEHGNVDALGTGTYAHEQVSHASMCSSTAGLYGVPNGGEGMGKAGQDVAEYAALSLGINGEAVKHDVGADQAYGGNECITDMWAGATNADYVEQTGRPQHGNKQQDMPDTLQTQGVSVGQMADGAEASQQAREAYAADASSLRNMHGASLRNQADRPKHAQIQQGHTVGGIPLARRHVQHDSSQGSYGAGSHAYHQGRGFAGNVAGNRNHRGGGHFGGNRQQQVCFVRVHKCLCVCSASM